MRTFIIAFCSLFVFSGCATWCGWFGVKQGGQCGQTKPMKLDLPKTEKFFNDYKTSDKILAQVSELKLFLAKLKEACKERKEELLAAQKKYEKVQEGQLSEDFLSLSYTSEEQFDFELQTVSLIESKKKKSEGIEKRIKKIEEAEKKIDDVDSHFKTLEKGKFVYEGAKKNLAQAVSGELVSLQILVPVLFENCL